MILSKVEFLCVLCVVDYPGFQVSLLTLSANVFECEHHYILQLYFQLITRREISIHLLGRQDCQFLILLLRYHNFLIEWSATAHYCVFGKLLRYFSLI